MWKAASESPIDVHKRSRTAQAYVRGPCTRVGTRASAERRPTSDRDVQQLARDTGTESVPRRRNSQGLGPRYHLQYRRKYV